MSTKYHTSNRIQRVRRQLYPVFIETWEQLDDIHNSFIDGPPVALPESFLAQGVPPPPRSAHGLPATAFLEASMAALYFVYVEEEKASAANRGRFN